MREIRYTSSAAAALKARPVGEQHRILQTVETVARNGNLGRSIGPEEDKRYYVDVRLDRHLARVFYAATEERVHVRDVVTFYISAQ